MAKILNLDNLIKEERILTFDGKSYAVKDMSVEDFVLTTKRAEIMDAKAKAGNASPLSERIEFMADSISPCIPDCPIEVLKKRSLEELNAIIAFVRDGSLPNSDDEIEESNAGGEEVAEKKSD